MAEVFSPTGGEWIHPTLAHEVDRPGKLSR